MNTYYLVTNLMYDMKHVVKKRWYHSVFGAPNLTLIDVKADSEKAARKKFQDLGYDFGIFSGINVQVDSEALTEALTGSTQVGKTRVFEELSKDFPKESKGLPKNIVELNLRSRVKADKWADK